MKRISFGLLRSLEIFDTDEKLLADQFGSFIQGLNSTGFTTQNLVVIGTANEIHPVFSDILSGNIRILDSTNNSIRLLANSREEFDAIVEKTRAIWEPFNDLPMLPRSEYVIKLFQEYVKHLQSLENVDSLWWIQFAFRELNIHHFE